MSYPLHSSFGNPMLRRSRESGFTLIELLVVIAIIGVLATMLLPALQQGKMRVKAAACLSNLQQIGSATRLYMQENTDRMPYAKIEFMNANPLLSQTITWDDFISPYLGVNLTSAEQWSPLNQSAGKIFACPADKNDLFRPSTRAFLTVDKRLPQQNKTKSLPFAIVLLRTKSNRMIHVFPFAPEILRRLAEFQPGPRDASIATVARWPGSLQRMVRPRVHPKGKNKTP